MPKEAPWQELAAELEEHGVESPYVARVMAHVRPEQQLANVEREIVQEIAGALGRSELRVNLALAELDLRLARLERARRTAAPASELALLVDAYNEQRLLAHKRRHELLIHREAVGFRRNAMLNELYPIPDKL